MPNYLMYPSNNIPPISLQTICTRNFIKVDFIRRYLNKSLITSRMGMQSLSTTCILPPSIIAKYFVKLLLVVIYLLNSDMDLSNGFHWRYSRKSNWLKLLNFQRLVILHMNLHFSGGFHIPSVKGIASLLISILVQEILHTNMAPKSHETYIMSNDCIS